ncbi:MAG: spore coat U domain-containing protein [Candidatus Rickettsia vulgarisii]
MFINQALALTATATFNVTANVTDVCTVSASTLSFGTYVDTAATDGQTTITVTCTQNTQYTVALDNGLYFNTTRNMQLASGTAKLSYLLYSDAARMNLWATTGTRNATGLAEIINVWGRIPTGQTYCSKRCI